jgi:hypothetical protein
VLQGATGCLRLDNGTGRGFAADLGSGRGFLADVVPATR